MKKMLLAAAASAVVLTSSAFAMIDNPCYLKVEGGAAIFQKVKANAAGSASLSGVKLKSNTSGIFGAGVGFYMMDNLRSELTFDYLPNPRFKKSVNLSPVSTPLGSITGGTVNIKHKGRVGSLLLSGYVDFYEAGGFKLYVGAGVGAAQVRETIQAAITPASGSTILAFATSAKIKRTYNFAYQLAAGASAAVADGVNVELGYSWRDYGKTKTATVTSPLGSSTVGKTRYRGHNVIAGLRFDI